MVIFSALRSKSTHFDEFFESGMEESVSPFLTPASRLWGKNLSLKSSCVAAILLLGAFLTSIFSSHASLAHLLLFLTYFFAGIPALIAAINDLSRMEINIDVLMTLSAFLAILIGSGNEGALLLVLFSFSAALEKAVRTKATSALITLKKLVPNKAFVMRSDGTLMERSVKDIEVGTTIFVKAGQVVPLDGKVMAGASSVNLVHLTGENLPQTKTRGDEVAAGALTIEGALTLEVIRTNADSTLSRIIQLITQAQEAKPKLQRWLDRISSRYATSIIFLAFLTALTLPLFVSIPFLGEEGSVYRALAFLIAASPCALILAVPIAYLSAISVCARQGILLKGGTVLDALASCTMIAFDKTGTLTKGELIFIGMEGVEKVPDQNTIELAYSLEQHAVHPIAEAICRYATTHNITPAPLTECRIVPGYGIEGMYQSKSVRMGNADFILPSLPLALRDQLAAMTTDSYRRGEILTYLSLGHEVTLFRFKDAMRPQVKKTLAALKSKHNLAVLMLTGDHEASAQAIALESGIDTVFSSLKPEDKLAHVTRLAALGNLAMVGDGVNDAPALARATVGISMGQGGSATAIDASEIVLLQDRIELLDWLLSKAKATVRIVKQNVCVAAVAIVCAASCSLLGWLPLWLAVLVHEGGTVAVGLNALRLMRKRS